MKATPVRLVRDSGTLLLYGQLTIWAYFIFSFTPIVPLLRAEQDTSYLVASFHGTAFAIGTVLGGAVIAPMVIARSDRTTRIWGGLAGVAVGIVALVSFRPPPATMLSVGFIALCGTIVANSITAALSDHHGQAGAAAISEANAVSAGVGVIAPLAIGTAVDTGWGWRFGLGVIFILLAAVAGVARHRGLRAPDELSGAVRQAGASATADAPGRSTRVGRRPRPGHLPRRYWLVFTALLCTASVEVCMNQWVPEMLRDRDGLSKGVATACVSALIVGTVLGRLISGRLALRVASSTMLLGGLAVSGAGFIVFWATTTGWLAVVGLMVCGLGNSVFFPLGMALAIDHSDGQSDLATAKSTYAFGFAYGVAPSVLAAIADRAGTHPAFLMVPLFLVISAAVVAPLVESRQVTLARLRSERVASGPERIVGTCSGPEVGDLQTEGAQ